MCFNLAEIKAQPLPGMFFFATANCTLLVQRILVTELHFCLFFFAASILCGVQTLRTELHERPGVLRFTFIFALVVY